MALANSKPFVRGVSDVICLNRRQIQAPGDEQPVPMKNEGIVSRLLGGEHRDDWVLGSSQRLPWFDSFCSLGSIHTPFEKGQQTYSAQLFVVI